MITSNFCLNEKALLLQRSKYCITEASLLSVFTLLQTVLRIWDCLFYEGSKILFRVALTLIHHNEVLIQQAQSLPDICQTFKQITSGPFVDDCHTFMQVKATRGNPPFSVSFLKTARQTAIVIYCFYSQSLLVFFVFC